MKINIKNKPTIFINKDFQTIIIRVMFPFKRNDNEIIKLSLLPNMLHYVTNKYKTEKELEEACENNYILNCFCSSTSIGDISFINFNMIVPNVSVLEEDLLEEQMQILNDIIYNPKINNNEFTNEEFQREINNLKISIEKGLKEVTNYAMIKAKELLDDTGLLSATIYNHKDQIDEITPSNLYNYYLDNVFNNKPMVYIFGDIDKEKITTLCDKYIYKNKYNNEKIELELKHYLKINKQKNKEEDSKFHNSVYISFYKVKDMSEDDEILLGLVNDLLSSSSSRILSKRLRDDKELVYQTTAFTYTNYGVLGIESLININNLDIVKDEITKAINDLKDENKIKNSLFNIKENCRINLIRLKDNKISLFTEKIANDLKTDISSEEYYEKLCKITAKDIKEFVDRLVLDTTYLLKEENHE